MNEFCPQTDTNIPRIEVWAIVGGISYEREVGGRRDKHNLFILIITCVISANLP